MVNHYLLFLEFPADLENSPLKVTSTMMRLHSTRANPGASFPGYDPHYVAETTHYEQRKATCICPCFCGTLTSDVYKVQPETVVLACAPSQAHPSKHTLFDHPNQIFCRLYNEVI